MVSIYPSFRGKLTLEKLEEFPQAYLSIPALKFNSYLPIIESYTRIAEIQGVAGYSNPPFYLNLQADSFYRSSGVWNTIESQNAAYEDITKTYYIKTLLTADNPYQTLTYQFPSGYPQATIIPWANKGIAGKVYLSGGTVYLEYVVMDLSTGSYETKTRALAAPSGTTNTSLVFLLPAGPNHFLAYVYLYTTVSYYYAYVIDYVSNTVTISQYPLGGYSYCATFHFLVSRADGTRVTIIAYQGNAYRFYAEVITNGTSITRYTLNDTYNSSNVYQGIVWNGSKGAWFMANNSQGTNYYVSSYIVGEDTVGGQYVNTVRGPIQGVSINNENEIWFCYQYASTWYRVGFNVNTYGHLNEASLGGTKPEAAYFTSGSGLVYKITSPTTLLIAGSRFYSPTYWRFAGLEGDTSKLIYNYTNSYQSGGYLVGGVLYYLSYDTTYYKLTVKKQDLRDLYFILNQNSYIRTNALNLVSPSDEAINFLDNARGIVDTPICRILDENNNLLASSKPYETVKLSSPISKAKFEIRGNNVKWNFLALRAYGVLYL